MDVTRREALKILAASGAAAAAAAALPSAGRAHAKALQGGGGGSGIIERDVAIIGGGSTGTYAAIRLRDQNKSVVVIEPKGMLGGHTELYVDPATSQPVNMGVITWHNLQEARDYLDRLGVAYRTGSIIPVGRNTNFVDLRTGVPVAGYVPPTPTQLPVLLGLISQYPNLEFGFDVGSPVPPELLMPWGDYLNLYGLNTLPGLVANFGQGLGDIMQQPTLYVMKNFGASLIQDLIFNNFLFPVSNNTHEIYDKAAVILGSDVMLNSSVALTSRFNGILLTVSTPQGPRLVKAKKMLITAPPLVSNLFSFALSPTEFALFNKFRPGYYYTAVVRVAGIPADVDIQNTGANTTYNLPPLPGIYGITGTGAPNLYQVKYGSIQAMTDAQVKAAIIADITRLGTAGTYPVSTPVIEAYGRHSPFELTVPTADIANGFYDQLSALQGQHHTFYTGAAFHTHDSAMLWRFTSGIVDQIVSAL